MYGNSKKFMNIPLLAGVLFLIIGCSATEPYQFDSSEKPSLYYKPKQQYSKSLKYPIKLGVLNVRDCRHLRFYNDEDGYFTEKIPEAVSNMMFSELKTSGIFKEVIKINEIPPETVSPEYMKKLKDRYDIEMALFTDLTRFNMLREKEGQSVIDTFKITVDIGFISQLIFLRNGYVVWADSIDRQDKELAREGALAPNELGHVTENAMASAIGDVKLLILKTGKVMKRR